MATFPLSLPGLIMLVVLALGLASDVQLRRRPQYLLYLGSLVAVLAFGRGEGASPASMIGGAAMLGAVGLAFQALDWFDARKTQLLSAFGVVLGAKSAALVTLALLVGVLPVALLVAWHRRRRALSTSRPLEPHS